MTILDGKKTSEALKQEIAEEVKQLKESTSLSRSISRRQRREYYLRKQQGKSLRTGWFCFYPCKTAC